MSKISLVLPDLNQLFPKQALVFTCLQYKSSENTVGKGEIAISPFLAVSSTRLENVLPFSSGFKLSSANSFSLKESIFFRKGMG